MDPRKATDFQLDAFADPSTVRAVVRGILHSIFFVRYFPALRPCTREVLGLDLAYVREPAVETLIEQRLDTLARALDAGRRGGGDHDSKGDGDSGSGSSSGSGSGRAQVAVRFFERRKRAPPPPPAARTRTSWFPQQQQQQQTRAAAEDEVCWETWTVKVTVAEPRTEAERIKVRRAAETTLQNTVFKLVTLANAHTDHIPPIMTSDTNPFPYQILVGGGGGGGGGGNNSGGDGTGSGAGTPRREHAVGWAARMGIY